jgi:AAA domain
MGDNQERFVRYICALPYPKRAGRIPELISDDPAAIEEFARRWDRPGYGVYECVSPLREGARRRSLENVGALTVIHSDIDLRTLQETHEQVFRRLQQLPIPLEIRDSGGGFHPVLHLKEEAAPGTAEFERGNAARSRLNHVLCADPAPNHAAALLRRLGTRNFKYGEPRPCQIIRPGKPVDITEVEAFLDVLGDRPLFTPLPQQTNGHDRAEGLPRSAGPIDVEARLAAMTFEGPGDSSIHWTQLQCSASLLRAGIPVEDVVTRILAATRRAAAGDPDVGTWNWAAEEHAVKEQCNDFISKNPELAPTLPDALFAAWNDRVAEGRTHLRITYARHIGWHIRSREPKPDEPDAEKKTQEGSGSPPSGDTHKTKASGWNYFDSTEPQPQCWLVKQLLPQTGVGIMAGQWGSFKTTAALDLSVAVMSGQLFAGQYRVKRPGAVLYFATEGAGTLQSRLRAIARHHGAAEKLPFAWRGDCPVLTDRDAGRAITKYVDEAAVHFEHAYGMSIVLIWIDTYITAAGLSSGDDNDVAATQKAFNSLRFVAAHSGAFVAVVDHLGKVAEAGTRGSSGKEGNADTVLANLAEREITGAVTNSRMAARKQRDGISGFEVPFTPETVELGLDEDGDAITAIVLSWGKQQQQTRARARKSKDRDLLARTLMDVVAKHGFAFHPDPGGPVVQACHEPVLREEFYKRCPAKGPAKRQADKRRNAFNRALQSAIARALIGLKETSDGGVVWAR